MAWLKHTVFDISVLAWLLSLIYAASIPFILFYLFFYLFLEPVLALLVLIALLFGGRFIPSGSQSGDDTSKDNLDGRSLWPDIVGSVALPIYVWAFLDRGFWSLFFVASVTVFFWVSTAWGYRREPIVDPHDNRFYSTGQADNQLLSKSKSRRRLRRNR